MATAIMKQKEVPEMDDVEKVISKISEESSYKRRPTQKRTWMTVPERYESILSALKNGTPNEYLYCAYGESISIKSIEISII